MNLKYYATLALLIILGFLGNYYSFSLFFRGAFLFGSIAVLLVLYFYGLGWGMLSAIVVQSYTYFLWGHPYAFFTFLAETLLVGLLLRAGFRNLLLLDGLFWLLIGLPMAYFFLTALQHMDANTVHFIMLKQAINSIVNALVASLAIFYLPVNRLIERPTSPDALTLRESLFNLVVALVLFPTLLLTGLAARNMMQDIEKDVTDDLNALSANVQTHLLSWYLLHMNGVKELARLADRSSLAPSAGLQQETEIIKQSFPDFTVMFVVNAAGITIAFDPPINHKGESTIGVDLSIRPWFKDLKATHQPVMSDVFGGDRASFAPIITLSVPILRQNNFLGLASGSLDLSRVRALLQPYKPDKDATLSLLDSQSRVIASTRPDLEPMQSWVRPRPQVAQQANNSFYIRHPEDNKLPSATRWKQSFYVQETIISADLPWKLIVEVPVAPQQRRLYALYLRSLAVMTSLVALALLLAQIFSRQITGPLNELAQVSRDLADKLIESHQLDWPKSSVQEVNSLVLNFQSMSEALEQNLYQLQKRSTELVEANQALHQEIDERNQAEEALRESEKRFRDVAGNAQEWVWEVNAEGKYTYASPVVEKLLSYNSGEIHDKYFYDLFIPEEREKLKEIALATFAAQQPFKEFINRKLHKNGSIVWLSTSGIPILDKTGNLLGYRGADIDITERKKAEEAIQASLQEKEVLLKEIHHRTKNNFQVVCSLLKLQSNRLKDPQLLQAFQDTGNRIRSMALVHEKLYQSKDLSHIDLKDYIKDLASFLLATYKTRSAKISLHLDLHSVIVNIETAMPCGLIINELLSNALKYAFPEGRGGQISIYLQSTDDHDIELKVADDGVGLPPEIDVWNTASLGFTIIAGIATQQLKGKLEVRRDQGTEFRFLFRELDYKPGI